MVCAGIPMWWYTTFDHHFTLLLPDAMIHEDTRYKKTNVFESLRQSNFLLSKFSLFQYLQRDRELLALHSTRYTVRSSEYTQATALDFFKVSIFEHALVG